MSESELAAPKQTSDPGAEQFILGLVIGTGRVEYFGELKLEDFVGRDHQLLWRAAWELHGERPIDQLTVFQWLEEHDPQRTVARTHIGECADLALNFTHLDPADPHIATQRALLHELTERRRTYSSVHTLASEVSSSTDLASISQKARAIVEITTAGRNGKGKLKALECPSVPASAWHGLAAEYRNLIGPCTEAPDAYHLACFFATIGAALGRSVFFNMPEPLYCWPYVVLVGVAGDPRKGTAMAKAARLVNAVFPTLYVLRSIDSAEGFAEKLQSVQNPDTKNYRPAIVRLTELRSLLDKASREGARNIMPRLCDTYDGEPLEVNTRKNAIRVEEPCVGLMSGTSKAYMAGLKKEDLEGGLGSRLMYIPGVPKERIAEPPEPVEPQYGDLVGEIADILKHWHDKGRTRFELTEEARRLWNPFYIELPHTIGDDPMVSVLAARHHHHAMKFAMVQAALDRSERIQGKHIGAAIVWVEFLLRSLYYIFNEFGLPPWVDEERRIVELVERAGPLGIPRRALQAKCWKMGAEQFNRRLKWLAHTDGLLREDPRGRKLWITLNE